MLASLVRRRERRRCAWARRSPSTRQLKDDDQEQGEHNGGGVQGDDEASRHPARRPVCRRIGTSTIWGMHGGTSGRRVRSSYYAT